jgi:phosphate transport system protein
MGNLAQKSVTLSVGNFFEGNGDYAKVQDLSDTLLSMANEVEDKTFELISRFQPVASDLRILKSYMKIAYDLTRYGRYAFDVSQICEKLGGIQECEVWMGEAIKELIEITLNMVNTSVKSLRDHDAERARTLSDAEKQVDQLYSKFLDQLIEKPLATNQCIISSVLVIRYLERIADHATYISESIVYLATGKKETLR